MKRSHSQQVSSPPPQASTSQLFLPKGNKKQKSTLNQPNTSRVSTPLASSPPPFYAIDERERSERSRSASIAPSGKGKKKAVQPATPMMNQIQLDDDPEEEEEENDFNSDEELEFSNDQKVSIQSKEETRVLLQHFSAEQMDRYELYRRSGLGKGSIRKLVNQVLNQSVSQSVITVVRGFSKVFVGEVVERARACSNHEGALTPADLREAYRLYLLDHAGPGGGSVVKKKMFRR